MDQDVWNVGLGFDAASASFVFAILDWVVRDKCDPSPETDKIHKNNKKKNYNWG
jgi:hypothetical protein